MADASSDVFANRDEPIPIVVINPEDESATTSAAQTTPGADTDRRRDALRRSVSPSRLKEKLEEEKDKRSASEKLQDKMFSALLQQVLPTEPSPSDPPDRRSRKYVKRPGFSVSLMSNNFRRFNARIGIAFVFQNRMIRLFTWRKPTQTMAFLAIYSFVCLDPYLLAVAPLAGAMFFIMVPAFLARHPPPPANQGDPVLEKELELYAYPLQGPPLAPARRIRPAPDLSKDFFRNMRDLQNSMEDFSRAHDAVVKTIAPLTNFSDEAVSSAVFLALAAITCPLFVFAHLLPWRAMFFVGGWIAIVGGHPTVARMLQSSSKSKRSASSADKGAKAIPPVQAPADKAHQFIAEDIVLSSSPEKREVEIFELQQRVTHTRSFFSATWDPPADAGEPEYEAYLFTPNPFTPLDPSRVSGARPRGTRFFEDVASPPGWKWSESKWRLDLGSAEWVGERCVSGVEVEMEGERWVWDIEYVAAERSNDDDDDEDAIADTYEAWVQRGGRLTAGEEPGKDGRSSKRKGKAKEKLPSWEEGNAGGGRKGQWRRRRWVRLVERRVVEDTSDAG